MCILLYVNILIGVVLFFIDFYGHRLERRGVWGSVCHGYMCILLYMKLMWCSGVSIDLWSIGDGGQSAIGVCAVFSM